jgi:hypothetical protein
MNDVSMLANEDAAVKSRKSGVSTSEQTYGMGIRYAGVTARPHLPPYSTSRKGVYGRAKSQSNLLKMRTCVGPPQGVQCAS